MCRIGAQIGVMSDMMPDVCTPTLRKHQPAVIEGMIAMEAMKLKSASSYAKSSSDHFLFFLISLHVTILTITMAMSRRMIGLAK